jgi:hypothetical protein
VKKLTETPVPAGEENAYGGGCPFAADSGM